MLKLIKDLFPLLTDIQRKKFYLLQVLVVLMTFLELIGIASIVPFMTLLGNMELLNEEGWLSTLYIYSGIETPESFTFFLGVSVLITLSISTLTSIFTTYRLSLFASHTGTEIADRLYKYYMHQDWIFHTSNTSASLTKQIANETQRVTTLILMPLMQINSRIVFASALSLAIFVYNPYVAIIGILVFTLAYFILFKTVRKRLHKNGTIISDTMAERYKLMNEGFGGIKETLLLGRQSYFIDNFDITGQKFAKAQGLNIVLAQAPRYLMELVAFGTLITLVLFLFKFYEGNLGEILPVLSVYALASFKLLPAFQQIYAYLAQIRGNISAFESIKEDLLLSQNVVSYKTVNEEELTVKSNIKLNNIYFKYPEKENYSLNDISLDIPTNSVIGIVGSSGSGKSTMIDLILGLINPQKGSLEVDGIKISNINKRRWQDKIGFVSQSIFLSQGTIAENIAFGLSPDKINFEQINKVVKMAHLSEMVNQLADGINTKVGERGVQLSGGQRQRIGIARALYHDAEILIFDEATSALDGITEKIIMEEIKNFIGQKTIIMIAHRLKTIVSCDKIFVLEHGKIIDSGSYDELITKNEHFKKMAENA
ncbi:ATP-binding cassette domain-containing protein [Poseidonibacter ostreae]|uniref:ABC transporter ATP-binding protein n=1 Tax=Poseidonibacter ostreae TaxID=2654171 RepID=UPI00126565D3|nr:ABC transporter ATP-binding protein [Poseidonibacter ostreae]KAB7884539.1 ATP-binding cassette domain-containing protein [Poseidonibacter ostreae]